MNVFFQTLKNNVQTVDRMASDSGTTDREGRMVRFSRPVDCTGYHRTKGQRDSYFTRQRSKMKISFSLGVVCILQTFSVR